MPSCKPIYPLSTPDDTLRGPFLCSLPFLHILILFLLFFWINRFVVDAADHDKLDAAYTELKALLEKPQLANIPMLVLGNKNDLEDALTAEQLIEIL